MAGQLALSERQKVVLQLIADDKRSAAIAAELHISVKAVEYHISAIRDALGVNTRAGAVAKALRDALIDFPRETPID